LANLESLSLSGNALTGRIPPELGNLARLYRLNLSDTGLSGPITSALGRLASLRYLYLGDNPLLTGRIPRELGTTSLEELNLLGNTGLTGALPRTFTQLSGLRSLVLQGTSVCVPGDADVQAWLATLSFFNPSGLTCDGSVGVAFGATSYTVTEGESVPVTVRLIDRSEGPSRSMTIGLSATPGRGATGADYAGVPASVTITAPSTAATFDFRATADNILDDAESVVLGLGEALPTGIALSHPATATVTIVDPAGAPAERAAVEALYHATNGPGWIDRTNWLTAAPLSEWFGVVTENGRVTGLTLPGNRLSGSLPAALGNLPFLRELNLAGRWDPTSRQWFHNALTGAIPPELSALANLESLHLDDNELSGTIPPELGALASLQSLSLDDNELSGSIPPELGALPNLEYLSLDDNELSGSIPPGLGALPNLWYLSLWGNHLSGTIPPELGALPNLEHLDISNNELRGPIPSELGALANLESLFLGDNGLSGPIPPELENLANLRTLRLGPNRVSGSIPAWLGNMTALRSLSLGGTELTGPIPPDFANLTNLDRLFLWDLGLTGPIPSWLPNLTGLRIGAKITS